jgi:hypothetical protein
MYHRRSYHQTPVDRFGHEVLELLCERANLDREDGARSLGRRKDFIVELHGFANYSAAQVAEIVHREAFPDDFAPFDWQNRRYTQVALTGTTTVMLCNDREFAVIRADGDQLRVTTSLGPAVSAKSQDEAVKLATATFETLAADRLAYEAAV